MVEVAVLWSGAAALVGWVIPCSRRQTFDSGANCGSDGNGRRSSRSYRSKLKPGLSGVNMNCTNSRSQLPKVRWLRNGAA